MDLGIAALNSRCLLESIMPTVVGVRSRRAALLTSVDEHRVVALLEKLPVFGVVGAEFDDGFAPHFVHFLRPSCGGEPQRGERQQAAKKFDTSRLINVATLLPHGL